MPKRSFPVPYPHAPPQAFRSRGEELARAVVHAEARLLTSCETIAMIGALGAQRRPQERPPLSVARAIVQDSRGGSGLVAAHLLPGQIFVDGSTPWSVAKSEGAKVGLLARFEVTALLPRAFNNADTQAEWVGLRFSFLEACGSAWTRVANGERHDLSDIYSRFLGKANHAFEVSRLLKEDRLIDALTKGDEKAAADRQNESEILQSYRWNRVTAQEASGLFPLQEYLD